SLTIPDQIETEGMLSPHDPIRTSTEAQAPARRWSRRRFLGFFGVSALALLWNDLLCRTARTPAAFAVLEPSANDAVLTAPGLTHSIVIREGQSLGRGLFFGKNNDFLAFFAEPHDSEQG